MKNLLTIAIVFLIFASCQEKESKKETVLDNISHTEDSIYYNIDSLPMFCDVLEMKKQFINIGDCKLYCEIEGEGIPLVLINGGPGGTHHCFHPWFAQANDFCQVIYYDQRGCGQSDFIKGEGYTFRQAIDDLDKLRQKLGFSKWIVCGYSYGGALAQYYTAAYPENVLGMVLIGSSTLLKNDSLNPTREYDYISEIEEQRIDEIYEMYSNKQITIFQLLFNKDLNGDWKRQNFYKPTKEELIRGALYEWVNDNNFNPIVGNSYQRYNFKNVFDDCPIPTVICEGKWDLTWESYKANILSRNHPNARLVLFENSGHSVYSDEPKLFFSTLKEFATNLKPVSINEIINWKKQLNKTLKPQEILFENEAHFFSMIKKIGIDEASAYYSDFKLKNENGKLFSENGMNNLGYSYLNKKDYATAIELFKMNVETFPNSWNVYDSLGEAYLKAGDNEKAIENYKKSLELNPENKNGKKVLEDITSKITR